MIFKASISCAHLIYVLQLSIGLPNAEYGEEGVYRQGRRNATVVGRADICDCLPPSLAGEDGKEVTTCERGRRPVRLGITGARVRARATRENQKLGRRPRSRAHDKEKRERVTRAETRREERGGHFCIFCCHRASFQYKSDYTDSCIGEEGIGSLADIRAMP